METLTQKIWQVQARKFARREVAKARLWLMIEPAATPSWKERLFGKERATVHYRSAGGKVVMI